jgi:MFS family permease
VTESTIVIRTVFVCLSGLFAATFPLTFAYIADCVDTDNRAAAYGLALATFGLSFSIGPILGGYASIEYGDRYVFLTSFLLVVVDVVYIAAVLPETVKNVNVNIYVKYIQAFIVAKLSVL